MPNSRIVIFISGRGSNLESIIKYGFLKNISLVVSDREKIQGLEIAKKNNLNTKVIKYSRYKNKKKFYDELLCTLEEHNPDLIVLAGFMRILPEKICTRFEDKIINIHPSLLPSFKGLKTHERALEEGVKIHGCSVHFVSKNLDSGPIILQAALSVNPTENSNQLSKKVLSLEHKILPIAIKMILEKKVKVVKNKVIFKNKDLDHQKILIAPEYI